MRLLIGLLVVAVGLGVASSSLAAELKDFLRAEELREVKISPNGSLVAMLRRETVDSLYIVRSADMTVVTGVNSTPGQRFAAIHWVNEERLLVETALEVAGFSEPLPTGELMGFSLDGRNNGLLKGNSSDCQEEACGPVASMYRLVHDLPNEPNHVLLARYQFPVDGAGAYARQQFDAALAEEIVAIDGGVPHSVDEARCSDGACPRSDRLPAELHRVNVNDGSSVLIARSPGAEATFFSDAELANVYFYGKSDSGLGLFRLDGERWQEIGQLTGGVGAVPIAFDGETLLALDNRGNTIGLTALDAGDGGLASVLFRDRVSDVEKISNGPDTDLITALRFSPAFPSWHYPDPESVVVRSHKALRAAFPEDDVEITSVSRDDSMAIALVSGDRNPGTYYLLDVKSGSTRTLLAKRSWLDRTALQPTEPISVRTRDGFTIHAYLTLPASTEGEAEPPLLVMLRDLPFQSRYFWGFDEEVQLFANAGYAVLQVNARGSLGYGRVYTAGSDAELARWSQRDVVDATRWVAEQELADRDRVCVYGQGLGGYSAIMALAAESDLYRCAISYGGVYDLDGPVESRDRSASAHFAYLRQRSEHPFTDSPLDVSDRLAAPVLLVHGERDSRVPFAQATAMRDALVSSGNAVETLFEGDAPARFIDPERQARAYARMLAFLANELGEAAARESVVSRDFTVAQVEQLQRVLDRIQGDVRRMTRQRDAADLPGGFQRSARSVDIDRAVRRAINGRDREVRRILRDEQWEKYEVIKQSYGERLKRSLTEDGSAERYLLPQPAS